jgi:hypothetical protein
MLHELFFKIELLRDLEQTTDTNNLIRHILNLLGVWYSMFGGNMV